MELKVNINVIIASKEDVNLIEDVLIKLGNGEFNVGSISTQNISSDQTNISQPVQEIQNVVPITPAQNTAPVQTQPVQTAVPTAAKTYTLEDLQRASGALVQAGKIQQLQGLLQQFNAISLAHLSQDNFGAFALKLRELGADI